VKQIGILIKKEILTELRTKTSFLSVGFYLVSLIYISYTTFQGNITLQVWNAILWLILLLSMLVAVGKSFVSEADRSLYLYHLIQPEKVVLSKLIFSLVFGLLLAFSSIILLKLFLPISPDVSWLFAINMSCGVMGLAGLFTIVSSISSNTANQSVIMTVLGFPIAIPILIVAVSNSRKILLGASFQDIQGGLITAISLVVIIIALLFILFPYSWKK